MAATRAKLDPGTDWESIVEGCYMSAHNFVLAGVEWLGMAHPQSHMHRDNPRLLKQVNASKLVQDAWERLEVLRAGNVYGGRSDISAADDARVQLQVIRSWAAGFHP